MIKKLFLLSSILTLSACSSLSERMQCDPEKNYIISNPEAMEKYKKEQSNLEVKSYYYKHIPAEKCNSNMCVTFDQKKYDFIEVYFDDEYRKGVYTITTTEDKTNPNCLPTHPITKNRKDQSCYLATKNKDDIVKSQYMHLLDATKKDSIYIEFNDIRNNISVFKFEYQIYSTGAIGGPGFGICPHAKINNPDYKFNPYSFP